MKKKKIELFEGTAMYYSKYRPQYPEQIYNDLIKMFALNKGSYILDLGCGPGIISIPLAMKHLPMYAVDPDIDMLIEGLKNQKIKHVHGIGWYLGNDKIIDQLCLPPLTMCIMGASFHWTNREKLVNKLNKMIIPNGAIIIISSSGAESCEEGENWNMVTKKIIQKFLGPKRRAGEGTYEHPEKRHQQILRASVFNNVVIKNYKKHETRSVDDLVGLVLSKSYSSPAQLGDQLPAFVKELSDKLYKLQPSGGFGSEEKYEVIIATRNIKP
jgi:ubiquinone/menaquinone biosynthesis C-methylase UbiE